MGQRTYTVEEYLERFEPEPNTGCWLWTGNVLGGYGVVSFNKIRKSAHKLSYEFYKNELVPTDKIIRHKCDNPYCINPKHLELGTNAENSRDMVLRGRSLKGSKNHQYGKKGDLATCYGRTGDKHPMFGRKHSEETKIKISNAVKGEKHPLYGKPMSSETKLKISLSKTKC